MRGRTWLEVKGSRHSAETSFQRLGDSPRRRKMASARAILIESRAERTLGVFLCSSYVFSASRRGNDGGERQGGCSDEAG